MSIDLWPPFLGFIEGFALIVSPCILSILPLILASSLAGSKKRPLGIILGFALCFSLFAFFARQILYYLPLDLTLIRYFSYGLLFLIALIMLSSYLSEKGSQLSQRLLSKIPLLSTTSNVSSDFISGLIFGALAALIWTPCAGPILAAILVQTILGETNLSSFFTLVAFSLGAVLPMLIIAFYGIKITDTFRVFKENGDTFRRLLGLIIIINLGYMLYQEAGFKSTDNIQTTIKTSTALERGLWLPYQAPELSHIEAWINSPPLMLKNLRGKVVLIDFWTYSCINCIRTLPYLKAWDKKYREQGLVIIGIHAPEFVFEKKLTNVVRTVKANGLQYPIALDNQFVNWQNFNNRYWPAHYLINKQGKIVYQHVGEGAYSVTENNIRFLLGVDALNKSSHPVADTQSFFSQTAETYLGYERADKKLAPTLILDKESNYQFPDTLASNAWALQGAWKIFPDKIISAAANASLRLNFKARKVFIVMGNTSGKEIELKILLKDINEQEKKAFNKVIKVNHYSIYELIDLTEKSNAILELKASAPGLEIYTFSFGG